MHEEEIAAAAFSILPALALAIPVAGAVVAALAGERRARLRNWAAVIASGATLFVVLQMMLKVFSSGPASFNLDIMRIGERFVCNLEVDSMGALFCFFSAVLWFAASLHAVRYMDHEHKRTRFFSFLMLTEAATLGVFMVQDFFSLYLFFEAMGLLAYVLVIHSETEKARSAATKYICMTVLGGLSLIGGIFLYLGYAGTVSFAPLMESAWLAGSFKVVALVCLIAGFGVKAGMVPLHVWLPDAHPVAPSPASALLSGVMIKAGAYGILRTCLTFFQQPAVHESEAQVVGGTGHAAEGAAHGVSSLASNVQSLGLAILVLAIITMFVGMLLALVQGDIKRTLAYSSVSQMGYILFGVGCMTYLGSEGAMGMAGSLYHIINHAFFKGCLFLAAGSILYCAHELDMFKLGGLWRRMPLTTIFWSIAALGIMGITFFNGFVSKTLLHHAVLESYHLAGALDPGTAGWVKAAEMMFIVTSGGTIAYIAKMTYYTFFRRPQPENQERVEQVREAPAWMLAGTGILAAGVLVCGLFPGLILDKLIAHPLQAVPGFNTELVEHVTHTSIFVWANVREIFIPLAIGIAIFMVGAWPDLLGARRRGLDIFQVRLPRWMGVDYWYVRGSKGALATLFVGQRTYAPLREQVVKGFRKGASGTVHVVRDIAFPVITERPLSWTRETTIRLSGEARTKLMPAIKEYQGDIAVGALVIAVSLTLFLIMRLL